MHVVLVALSLLISIVFGTACGPTADVGATSAELPDGLVVYMASKGHEQALVVESLDGRSGETYHHSASSIAVAPGGEALAFVAARGRGKDIFVLRTQTGTIEPLRLMKHLAGTVSGLEWSPAGDALAFAVHEPTGFCGPVRTDQIRLHTVRADGTDLRSHEWYPSTAAPLKDNPTSISTVTWSPDGRQLLYAVSQGSDCEVRGGYLRETPLCVTDMSGGAPVTIAKSFFLRALAWSPDGAQVALTSDDVSDGAVTFVSLRGGERRSFPSVYGDLVWTRRGIYTTANEPQNVNLDGSYDETSSVVLLEPKGGRIRQVTRATYPTFVATATGSHVAVVDGDRRLRVFSFDGKQLLNRTVTGADGFALTEDDDGPIVTLWTRRTP